MDNNWRQKYFEKNIDESHANIFKSLEIEQYLKQIFKNRGSNLHNFKISFSNFVINVFVSVCKIERKTFTFNKRRLITEEDLILRTKKCIKLRKHINKHFMQQIFFENFTNKLKCIKALHSYKQCLLELKANKTLNVNGFCNKILESLSIFTHNNFNINLIIQEIDFINSSFNAQQVLLNLRRFEKTLFFKEGKFLFKTLVNRNNVAKLLGSFIASQLEQVIRHNFFFNFLQENLTLIINQKLSKTQGVKINIAGRFSNAARSRTKIIKSGKISLLKINSKIDYSESTAYTSNGTFGIKVWIRVIKTNEKF